MMVSLVTGTCSSESCKAVYGLTTRAKGNLDFFNKDEVVGITFNVERKYSWEAFAVSEPGTIVLVGGMIKGGGGNDNSLIGGGNKVIKSVVYNWFKGKAFAAPTPPIPPTEGPVP